VHAPAFHIELPGVEHAGHVLRISRRRSFRETPRGAALDQVGAVGADIEEGADLVVGVTADDDRLACDGHRPEVVRFGQFRFVADRNPDLLPDFLKLFLEDLLVAVDTAVRPFDLVLIGVCVPLLGVSSHV